MDKDFLGCIKPPPDIAEMFRRHVESLPPPSQSLIDEVAAEKADLKRVCLAYHDQKEKLKRQIREKEASREYAMGGQLMPRGYYCPSLIRDIVISNVNRGRLLDKKPRRVKCYYEYVFDKDHKLLACMTYTRDFGLYQTEYIVVEDEVEYGLSYHFQGELETIHKAVFHQGQIVKWMAYSVLLGSMNFMECYQYEKERLVEAISYHSLSLSDLLSDRRAYQGDSYRFQYDSQGKLYSYTYGKDYAGLALVRPKPPVHKPKGKGHSNG